MSEVADKYGERYCHQVCSDALAPWLNHSVMFVNSVAERWRICRQVGNISAILEKRAPNADEGQGRERYVSNIELVRLVRCCSQVEYSTSQWFLRLLSRGVDEHLFIGL